MLLAVPVKGEDGLEALVDHHFSRAPYYLLYETGDGAVRSVRNISAQSRGQHEGPIEQLYDAGVRAIACSGIGPAAIDFAAELGIPVCFGRARTAGELIEKYREGGLESLADGSPCQPL